VKNITFDVQPRADSLVKKIPNSLKAGVLSMAEILFENSPGKNPPPFSIIAILFKQPGASG